MPLINQVIKQRATEIPAPLTPEAYTYTATDFTLTAAHSVLEAYAASASFNVYLPAAIAGTRYYIKKTDTTRNIVYVTANGIQTIDGSATYTLELEGEFVQIVASNSGWLVVGE